MKRQISDILASYERCYLTSKCGPECAYYAIKKWTKVDPFNPLPCNKRMMDDIHQLLEEGKIRIKVDEPLKLYPLSMTYYPLEIVQDE